MQGMRKHGCRAYQGAKMITKAETENLYLKPFRCGVDRLRKTHSFHLIFQTLLFVLTEFSLVLNLDRQRRGRHYV